MGQLTCFVVVCRILLEASARLPMMSLSKIELRQLVGKTSHSATLSEIPHRHHLGQLPQLPPQSRCPLIPLCYLAQEHPTNNSGEKKKILATLSMIHFHRESRFEFAHLPPVWSPLPAWRSTADHCLRPKAIISILS